MDAASIGEMLRHEHPQIVAAVLVHLDSDQAAAVLKTFAERQRNEVLVRIATLDGIQPSALKDLSEVMGRMVAGGEQARMAPLGGVKTAAEMINLMGTSDRDRGARLHPRGRQRPRAADHGQHVHLRRPDASVDDQRHPGAAEGSAVGVARRRAQGRQARAARQAC